MALSGDQISLLALSARIACIGLAVQSFELVALVPLLRRGQLLQWRGTAHGGRIRRLVQETQAFPASVLILAARGVVAVAAMLVSYGTPMAFGLFATLAIVQLYYNRRFELIFANSDNIALVVLVALTVGAATLPTDRMRQAALAFLAYHCVLAYVGSGMDKVFSENWRSGRRLVQIFQDSSHRFPRFGDWLARRPRTAAIVSWSVILFELLFVIGLIVPTPLFLIFLWGGLVFHAGIAVLMALPGFFWMFAATYPGVYFVHEMLMRFLYR